MERMEKQLTAVEWLVNEINKLDMPINDSQHDIALDIIDKAKQMEKQNIIDFATKYDEYCHKSFVNNRHQSIKSAEEFYDETFKSE